MIHAASVFRGAECLRDRVFHASMGPPLSSLTASRRIASAIVVFLTGMGCRLPRSARRFSRSGSLMLIAICQTLSDIRGVCQQEMSDIVMKNNGSCPKIPCVDAVLVKEKNEQGVEMGCVDRGEGPLCGLAVKACHRTSARCVATTPRSLVGFVPPSGSSWSKCGDIDEGLVSGLRGFNQWMDVSRTRGLSNRRRSTCARGWRSWRGDA